MGGGEFAGGDVRVGDACPVVLDYQGGQVVVTLFFEQRRFHHGARRDHPCHLAGHQTAHRLVAHLIHDSHLVPRLDEPGEVAVNGVIGHSGQWHPLALPYRPRGEDDIASLGDDLRVLVESLVEIPQAEEDDGVGVLLLDLQILAAHWS